MYITTAVWMVVCFETLSEVNNSAFPIRTSKNNHKRVRLLLKDIQKCCSILCCFLPFPLLIFQYSPLTSHSYKQAYSTVQKFRKNGFDSASLIMRHKLGKKFLNMRYF